MTYVAFTGDNKPITKDKNNMIKCLISLQYLLFQI